MESISSSFLGAGSTLIYLADKLSYLVLPNCSVKVAFCDEHPDRVPRTTHPGYIPICQLPAYPAPRANIRCIIERVRV